MTKIYEAQNHILICSEQDNLGEHRHMAAHIIISLAGEMKVRVGEQEYLCRGVQIPSGVVHKIETAGQPVLVFLYDSTTNIAREIKEVQTISVEVCTGIVASYKKFVQNEMLENYQEFQRGFLEQIGMNEVISCVTDERIIAAMKYVRENMSGNISCRQTAESVFLSESRFSHLFKEQVGMTFAAYVVYQRIMYVYTQILQGTSITEAALAAGFSGSAHFADVNRRVFGLSASSLTHDLSFNKVQ